MSKRTKKIRSNRSGFMLEALEQRQLLATIVSASDSGTKEVNTDVLLNGKIYDQILLTGSSVTVKADAGQIVRVDWLDKDGDLVRAEFAGSGTMTINLADFVAAAVPANYATTQKYVAGLGSITIEGSAANTNVLITSLGPVTAFNGLANPIFGDGTKLGGNNIANVSTIIIRADQANPLGSDFGSIYAGNAVFSGTSGAVGIVAPSIQFKGTITIGNISAAGSATGVLQLGDFSDTKTVTVAGGDLKAASGATNATINFKNVSKITSTTGTTSKSSTDFLETKIISSTAGFAGTVAYSSSLGALTIDGSTVTQTALDAYKGKFLGDVTINGGLAAGLTFKALQFGNITVNGDLAGVITTDVNDLNNADGAEQGIGNVMITGQIKEGGYIEASQSIGTVNVAGKVTHTVANAAAVGIIDAIAGSVGAITLGGDVSVTGVESLVIAGKGISSISGGKITASTGANTAIAGGTGAVGALTFTDVVSLTSTTNVITGAGVGVLSGKGVTLSSGTNAINSTKGVGGISSNGAISVTGVITAADGDVGAFTTTGDGNIALGAVTATTGSIGDITVKKGDLTVGALTSTAKAVGNITVNEGDVTLAAITAGTSVGNIAAQPTTTTAKTLTLGGAIAAGTSVGNISNANGNVVVNAAVGAKTTIGDITVTKGNLTFGAAGKFLAVNGTDWAGTAIGKVTVSAGKITGNDGMIEFQANKIGDVTVKGAAATGTLLTDVIFSAKGTTQATVGSAWIGNIVLDNGANATATSDISTSTNASTTASTGSGFSSSGSLGNVTIKTGTHASAQIVNAGGLVFRAGSSEMGAVIVTPTDAATALAATQGGYAISASNGAASSVAVESVAVGNVSITGNLGTGAGFGGGTVGGGLIIASGVNSVVRPATTAAANVAFPSTTKTTSGQIGDLSMVDVSTTVAATPFNSSLLKDITTNDTGGGSLIIADKIASISLSSGAGDLIVKTGLNGAQLKGAIGAPGAVPDVSKQEYAGTATSADSLMIVVL